MDCCESSVEGVAIVPCGGGGGLRVCYDDGDPTRCDPVIINHIKTSAELATDVFNKTHIDKYSFLELVYATTHFLGRIMDLMFTAKPVPVEDDRKPVTFRARIYITGHYVEFLDLVPPAHLLAFYRYNHFFLFFFLLIKYLLLRIESIYLYMSTSLEKMQLMKPEKSSTKKPEKIWMEKLQECSVVSYDSNPTRCDDQTTKIREEWAGLAVEVYNKTHPVTYILVEVVNATEYFSAGSMLHVKFTAKCMYESDTYVEEEDIWDDTPRTLHALVSITHNYVEFVDLV
ncbi:hypothetical protein ABFS83_06G102900 [Erythranthe nasuta]